MTKTLKLTPHESLTVTSSTPEALVVEATYGPGGSPPPKHLHPAQDEHFEVLSGSLRAHSGDRDVPLKAGATIDIPRGTAHQMWNEASGEARVRWTTTPAGRTEQWFEEVDALMQARKPGDEGMPGPLEFGVLMNEYDDTFRLAVGPQILMKPVVMALAFGGRLRGHRPSRTG